MLAYLVDAFRALDSAFARAHLALRGERNSMIAFLFHRLRDGGEARGAGTADPRHGVSLDFFRRFIEHFLSLEYKIIAPDDILRGLDQTQKHVMITFDDGYFNNTLALPVLREYRAPAAFFVSTGPVLRNECFWWDVVYREMRKAGKPRAKIKKEVDALKMRKSVEIARFIRQAFGEKALLPQSDADRPFSPGELRDFAREPFVHIGNHTRSHAILTNYSAAEACEEIAQAQRDLLDLACAEPIAISYPNGSFGRETICAARQCGLKLGIATIGLKNYLPIDTHGDEVFRLKRFTLSEHKDLAAQCDSFRSDARLIKTLRRIAPPWRSLAY